MTDDTPSPTNLPRICLVLPYFGKLPPYWGGFVDSCKDNTEIDFLIVTDCLESSVNYAPNIKVVPMSWLEMRRLIAETYSRYGIKKVCTSFAYKLCDYKPTYGVLFNDHLKNYDYWGYIDCDLVFGNLAKFLTKIGIDRYDRVYSAGHLSIYRNSKVINELFSESIPGLKNFKTVSGTSMIHNFDETTINEYFRRRGLKFYDSCDDATFGIYCSEYKWRNACKPDLGELFVKALDGSTYVYVEHPNGSIEKVEVNYIHFMTKKNVEIPFGVARPYCITRQGIMPFHEKDLAGLLKSTVSDTATETAFANWQIRQFRKSTLRKVIRELRFNKFRVIGMISRRIPSYIKYMLIARKYGKQKT